jgi:hypothetical protein
MDALLAAQMDAVTAALQTWGDESGSQNII